MKMITKRFNSFNIIFVISIILYIALSFIVIKNRIPYFDEINAWNIASYCNFFELFEVSKHEGHFVLWYLLLKPFAQNNIGFPYLMFFLNWIFAFISVLILWIKSPFNSFIKIFITFSLPFQMYSVYARCYAIGVMLLFIICSLYKKRVMHNILYPILIILLANTSVIGAIISFYLGLIYINDLINGIKKQDISIKHFIYSVSIFLFGAAIIILQINNYHIPWYAKNMTHIRNIITDFSMFYPTITSKIILIIHLLLLLTGFKFFKETKLLYVVLMCFTGTIIFISFNIYTLAIWHYLFFYIILISTIWIYIDNYEIKSVFQKLYYYLFGILCFLLIFYFKYPWHWNGFHIPTTQYIENNYSEYINSNIFMYPTDSSVIGIIQMLRKNNNIDFYSSNGYSYKTADAYIHQWDKKRINYTNIKEVITKNPGKKNFLIVPIVEQWKLNNEDFINSLKENNTNIKFIPYNTTNDVIIYKINY